MTGISTSAEVLDACRHVLESSPAEPLPDLPVSGLTGQRAWHYVERQAWAVGEQIRQALVRKPALRKQPGVLEAIAECALSRNLGRGRQSFVMLVGCVAARNCADAIARLCSDPDVAGHAVDSLIKMRAPGYAAQVHPLLSAPHAWIRRKASTYLQRYGSPELVALVPPNECHPTKR
jgi:hypothetical protein